MGFLVAFNRKMYLTNYIHNLQTQLNDRTSMKLQATDQIAKLNSQMSDLGDNDSPAVKKLEARKVEIEQLEKKLDVEMQKIQTQLQAANTELQSADQMLEQNLQRSFSYKAA